MSQDPTPVDPDQTTIREVVEEHQPEPEHSVSVTVSFQIIRQFSEQMYTNPRRAIEELVCNSYDAGAEGCWVSTPDSGSDVLKVLDNGKSMDLEGIEWLWTIAESPKQRELDDERVQYGRQQIGKFGVGKLSSFALGSRLTHVATKDGKTRVISVNQNELPGSGPGTTFPIDEQDEDSQQFEVFEFDSDEAESILSQFFGDLPNPWDEDWETWTLAVVGDVDEENTGNDLRPWLLKKMIQTAIPLSAQFNVQLNGEEIPPREPRGEEVISADVTEEGVIERIEELLKEYWVENDTRFSEKEDVPSELFECEVGSFPDPENTDQYRAGISVPNLGPVMGSGTIYDRVLTTEKREERGFEDHGFRVYVRGRLLNRGKPLFGLDQLSHRYFPRFLGEVEVPGLDDVILVQRDAAKEGRIETSVTRRVLRGLFNYLRTNAKDSEGSFSSSSDSGEQREIRSFSDRLQMRSPRQGYEALVGLNLDDDRPVDPDTVEIDTTTLGHTDYPVKYDPEDNEIQINDEHPLHKTLSEQVGFSENIRDTIEEILAGALLIVGFLRYNRQDDRLLEESHQLFDYVLRSAAEHFRSELDHQLEELHRASVQGGTEFEQAIAEIFKDLGLSTVTMGGPDRSDGIISLPMPGEPNYLVAIEAKGSQGIVDHQQVNLSTVDRHRGEDECDHAIVIAREFQTGGIGEGQESGLLRELDENASLITTEAMEVLLRLHQHRRFTYSQAKRILKNKEHPDNLPEFILGVWEETPDNELMRNILLVGHEIQESRDDVKPSIGALTMDDRLKGVDRTRIADALESLEVLTGRVHVESDGAQFSIDSAPDAILDQLGSRGAESISLEEIGIEEIEESED